MQPAKEPPGRSRPNPSPSPNTRPCWPRPTRATPTPYRPWETYEVGQCIQHLAWEDCGVVVAKEELPGGRQVIKCFFEEAGVVRLIENAAK